MAEFGIRSSEIGKIQPPLIPPLKRGEVGRAETKLSSVIIK